MEKQIRWKVEGMSCTACSMNISQVIRKYGGTNIYVDFISGEAKFDIDSSVTLDPIEKSIHKIGYTVISSEGEKKHSEDSSTSHGHDHSDLSKTELRFLISLIFTIPLLIPMVVHIHFLMNPMVQLMLCLPVMIIGGIHFGRSAIASVISLMPNMDVLICIGSFSAFIYSLAGTFMIHPDSTQDMHHYLFYETGATIITLVLLGNLIEHRAVKRTTIAIKELKSMQPHTAKLMIGDPEKNQFTLTAVENINKGDFLLVNRGDKIPVDGKIVKGEGAIDESMISGESLPVEKKSGDLLIGGTILETGGFVMKAENIGEETTLSQIIRLVKDAQAAKPKIQRIGDRVSAIFVPIVILISLGTLLISWLLIGIAFKTSLMNSIAVLVISCPCAMGLATPTALMVGLGKAARKGILVKGGDTLENLEKIKTIVLDKTGTLTTGNFLINKIISVGEDENIIRSIIYHIESRSSHPIAVSMTEACKDFAHFTDASSFTQFEEEKGLGMKATDSRNNIYRIGSFQIAKDLSSDNAHQLYMTKNNILLSMIDIEDEIKTGAKEMIAELKKSGIHTVMLSGDTEQRCRIVADKLGITEVYSNQTPSQKIEKITELAINGAVAMAGDGINDAPALTKATVGISISGSTQIAIQSAQIILLNKQGLQAIPEMIAISKQTMRTIRQNLFWAFFYNIIAIPFAAAGFLSPMI